MMDEEMRDRAARAAFDAFTSVAAGEPGDERRFKVAIIGWRAVVDAVARVLAEREEQD